MSLSVRDRLTLTLAATRYRHPARRETDAHRLLGMTPATFWRHVGILLDDPEALAAMPTEVNRLRRLRERRRNARAA